MARLVTTLILLVFGLTALGQNSFYKSLIRLSEIDYVVTTSNNCSKTIQDEFGCFISPEDNWYNKSLTGKKINSLDTIDSNKLRQIESYDIKGTKELQPKMFGRAEIQKWTFVTSKDADHAWAILSKADFGQREDLHKAPWTWWRHEENIYFILTSGTYVKPDLERIERTMKNEQ